MSVKLANYEGWNFADRRREFLCAGVMQKKTNNHDISCIVLTLALNWLMEYFKHYYALNSYLPLFSPLSRVYMSIYNMFYLRKFVRSYFIRMENLSN